MPISFHIGTYRADAVREKAVVIAGAQTDTPRPVQTAFSTADLYVRNVLADLVFAGAASLVGAALTAHGRVDIVVANAGTSWHQPFADLTAADVQAVFGPSVLGTFNVVHAAWPHLVAQRYGRVVTTSSGAVFGFAGRAHYAAAKGAVLALTNNIALEGAALGVFANCVLPWGATRLSRPGGGAPDAALAAPPVAWLCHEHLEVVHQTPEGYRDALTRT